jgi:23S rRNA (adenine2503-C2)-methyltransferase
LPQMEGLLTKLGAHSFHGRQVYKWLYNVRQFDFQLMTDLSKELRTRLDESCTVKGLSLQTKSISRDGTEKYLFRLHDGHPVESVLIPEDYRRTLCISSQAGCAIGCKFCATGTMGLLRDLSVGEIIGQLLYAKEIHGDDAFSNVVMMGMGEPLMNYNAVMDAVRIMVNESGFSMSAKRITVSTSGVTPKIKKMAESGLKPRLAISLHAATQEKRRRIMPIADTFSLEGLIEATRHYSEVTASRVTFEYVLLKDFNDSKDDVGKLGRLVRGIDCKVNLLAYNPVPGLAFERPSDERVDWFARQLLEMVPAVTVRRSRGRDIEAACGQLAARQQNNSH